MRNRWVVVNRNEVTWEKDGYAPRKYTRLELLIRLKNILNSALLMDETKLKNLLIWVVNGLQALEQEHPLSEEEYIVIIKAATKKKFRL